MGKDLPLFSGNPEEWPIWMSNFQRSTATCGFSLDENLIRLQHSLRGAALDAVRSRLFCPSSVPHVIKTLEMRYGRPETLIRIMTERIKHLPPPRMNDLDSIIEFGLAVDNLVEHLRNAVQQAHLSNPSLLHDLVIKLPVDYRLKWSAYKSSTYNTDLGVSGRFMSSLVELAYEVADEFPTHRNDKVQKPKAKERMFVQTHAEYNDSKSKLVPAEKASRKPCPICKLDGHKTPDCIRFKGMSIDNRWKVVDQQGLCRTCLNQHGKWPCRTWKGCEISECTSRHHTLLHSFSPTVRAAVSTSHLSGSQENHGLMLRILPVTLFGEKCQVNIYTFVDEGSEITLL